MNYWFQNLNEQNNKLFYFRGDVGWDYRRLILHYEFSSGPAMKLEYSCRDGYPQWILGLGFFTAYLSSPYLKLPFFKPGLDYGISFRDWTLWWNIGTKPFEWNSRTPKWRQFSLDFLDFFFGKTSIIDESLVKVEAVKFKIGEKEFLMNEIAWVRRTKIRRNIPYNIYNQKWISLEMKIEKPPMRAGKGENTWDCDDDGAFGMYSQWKHKIVPNYSNRKECAKLAVEYYCDSAIKDSKKYGSGSGERGINYRDSIEVAI